MYNDRIWVAGESGVNLYLVAPGTCVTLWDSEAPVIYLKSADTRGVCTVQILDYTVREPAKSEVELLREELAEVKELLRGVSHESTDDDATTTKSKK
jgi:hypothetical protein